MPARQAFLLVSDEPGDDWPEVVRRALLPLGDLRTVGEAEALAAVGRRAYAAVILDTGAVADAPALVALLRRRRPGLRVVVVTASPTWRRARDAMHEGAADYVRKTHDEDELRGQIASVLQLPADTGPAAD